MSVRHNHTTVLEFLNDDEGDDEGRVQVTVRRTNVEDVAEDQLEDYPVAITLIDSEEDENGDILDRTAFALLDVEEIRALRDYLDEVLATTDCDGECDEDYDEDY